MSAAASKTRPVVLKTAGIIVLAAAAFAFAGRITAFALEPVLATYRTGLEIQHLEADAARRAAVNDRLRADIQYLRTRAGVEQEARLRGWVRPGEVALSVIAPESKPGVRPAPAVQAPVRTASAAPSSISEQIRAALDTCLAVFGGGSRHPR